MRSVSFVAFPIRDYAGLALAAVEIHMFSFISVSYQLLFSFGFLILAIRLQLVSAVII